MAINNLMKRMCVQTAVYWGNPTPDGRGGKTFDTAVEIACRWQNKVEKVGRVGGTESEVIISNAQVFVIQDVEELGYLYLGVLDDLDSDPDPLEVGGAYEIKKFEKSPALRHTDEFVRKAYL